MSSQTVVLLYFSSIAGFCMVVGGIWLIYKEKIYIDRESGEVSEVKTPVGTFRTNVPALLLFVLGFFPLAYPIYVSQQAAALADLHGTLTLKSDEPTPIRVYAVVAEEQVAPGTDREYLLKVPAGIEDYKVFWQRGDLILDQRWVSPGDELEPLVFELRTRQNASERGAEASAWVRGSP